MDAFVLHRVAAEIREALLGTRLDRAVQPDWRRLDLRFRAPRRNGWVRFQLGPVGEGAILAPPPPDRGIRDAPLRAALQREASGAELVRVETVPGERLLHLDLLRGGPRGRCLRLVLEMTGRSSNVLLLDPATGAILECMRRLPPGPSIRRPQRPGEIYRPPPRPAGRSFLELGREGELTEGIELPDLGGREPREAVQLLRQVLPDLPPRAAARMVGLGPGAIAERLDELARDYRGGKPEIWQGPDGFTAGLVDHPDARRLDQVSPAILADWEKRGQDRILHRLRGRLDRGLRRWEDRDRKLAGALESSRAEAEGAEETRLRGQILMTHQSRVPRGSTEVVLPGFDGKPVRFELNPAWPAQESARRLFRRAGKLARGRAVLDRRLAEVRLRLEEVRELRERLVSAGERLEEVQALAAEVTELGLELEPGAGAPAGPPPAGGPLRFTSPEGLVILVGRSARENDRLTGVLAQPHDFWLHARGRRGAHVVVRNPKRLKELPPRTRDAAALLAAHYSSARRDSAVDVLVTQRRQVKKVKGGPPGLVRLGHHRTVTVRPDPEEVQAMAARSPAATR